MRASVLVLGPMLARHGRARVSLPGGCAIGERPINLHLEGLQKMGAEVALEHGYVETRAKKLRGTRFDFGIKTVTGTENLMMAATLAEGTTVLGNCAQEPEVVDLARMLTAMGASIDGAGTDEITIEGRPSIGSARHDVIPDRIEAGTYLVAGALLGDPVELVGCRIEHLRPVVQQLRLAGVPITSEEGVIRVRAPERLVAHDLQTAPHPGFPTDMQAQYMALDDPGPRNVGDHRDRLRAALHARRRAAAHGRRHPDPGSDLRGRRTDAVDRGPGHGHRSPRLGVSGTGRADGRR